MAEGVARGEGGGWEGAAAVQQLGRELTERQPQRERGRGRERRTAQDTPKCTCDLTLACGSRGADVQWPLHGLVVQRVEDEADHVVEVHPRPPLLSRPGGSAKAEARQTRERPQEASLPSSHHPRAEQDDAHTEG